MRFYDPQIPKLITQDRLTHWDQSEGTYFITFRLADSLPADFMRQLERERAAWLLVHPKPWELAIEREYHRLFSSKVERCLDQGQGSRLLADPPAASLVMNALRHFEGSRCQLHSAVVTPNHVHCLVTLAAGQVLHRLVQSWKSFTAHQLGAPRVWQRDYFDRLIRDADHFGNVRHYIRNNPVKAGLAEGTYLLHEA